MTDDPGSPGEIISALEGEIQGVTRELAEIEMLIGQARAEAGRHEQKRAAMAERFAGAAATPHPDPAELADLNEQVVRLTRRAAIMEAQADVLEGKHRTLGRFRDGLTRTRDRVAALGDANGTFVGAPPGSSDGAGRDDAPPATPAIKRLMQTAQEDLRRDIARAMHDGPAQSLTNIVLQAQILERLFDKDPGAARAELRELIAMVQRTLEATKTFIFDVRPMVLDDLGLVPTLRRVARDRSRRAHVPVEFESLGADRRLSMNLETAVFRMVDEAVVCFTDQRPGGVRVGLDWGERDLAVVVEALAAPPEPVTTTAEPSTAHLPPALASFLEDRRARPPEEIRLALPPDIRREIADRAQAVRGRIVDGGDGPILRFSVPLPAPDPPLPDAEG